MMSKPAVQVSTAAASSTGAAHDQDDHGPDTAIHAPTGAIASPSPSATWASEVTRLVYEYPSTIASATGARARHTGDSAAAAATKSAVEAASTPQAHPAASLPLGSGREAVRGLAASMARSAMRLKVIAAVRAPTMAATIQAACHAVGSPPAPRTIPITAKGSANRVCGKATSSPVSRARCAAAASRPDDI